MEEISVFRAADDEAVVRLAEHRSRIGEALEASLSGGTREAYRKAIARLHQWAETEGFEDEFAPATLAAHITDLAQSRSQSTISIILAAVRAEALERRIPNPVEDPTLKRVIAGVRRQIAARGVPMRRAHALTTPEVARILSVCDPATPAGRRDAAIIALLYAGALRRSEVENLRRSDVQIGRDGMTIRIRRAKGDQFGAGATVGVVAGRSPQTDPVAAMRRWLVTRAASAEDPLFVSIGKGGALGVTALTGHSIGRLLRARAVGAGLDVESLGISGHSGRRGHVTAAASAGADLARIAKTTRHKNVQTLMAYVAEVNVLATTTSSELGL